jgi:hypothetical protein
VLIVKVHIRSYPMDDLLALVLERRDPDIEPSIALIEALQSYFLLQLLTSAQ